MQNISKQGLSPRITPTPIQNIQEKKIQTEITQHSKSQEQICKSLEQSEKISEWYETLPRIDPAYIAENSWAVDALMYGLYSLHNQYNKQGANDVDNCNNIEKCRAMECHILGLSANIQGMHDAYFELIHGNVEPERAMEIACMLINIDRTCNTTNTVRSTGYTKMLLRCLEMADVSWRVPAKMHKSMTMQTSVDSPAKPPLVLKVLSHILRCSQVKFDTLSNKSVNALRLCYCDLTSNASQITPLTWNAQEVQTLNPSILFGDKAMDQPANSGDCYRQLFMSRAPSDSNNSLLFSIVAISMKCGEKENMILTALCNIFAQDLTDTKNKQELSSESLTKCAELLATEPYRSEMIAHVSLCYKLSLYLQHNPKLRQTKVLNILYSAPQIANDLKLSSDISAQYSELNFSSEELFGLLCKFRGQLIAIDELPENLIEYTQKNPDTVWEILRNNIMEACGGKPRELCDDLRTACLIGERADLLPGISSLQGEFPAKDQLLLMRLTYMAFFLCAPQNNYLTEGYNHVYNRYLADGAKMLYETVSSSTFPSATCMEFLVKLTKQCLSSPLQDRKTLDFLQNALRMMNIKYSVFIDASRARKMMQKNPYRIASMSIAEKCATYFENPQNAEKLRMIKEQKSAIEMMWAESYLERIAEVAQQNRRIFGTEMPIANETRKLSQQISTIGELRYNREEIERFEQQLREYERLLGDLNDKHVRLLADSNDRIASIHQELLKISPQQLYGKWKTNAQEQIYSISFLTELCNQLSNYNKQIKDDIENKKYKLNKNIGVLDAKMAQYQRLIDIQLARQANLENRKEEQSDFANQREESDGIYGENEYGDYMVYSYEDQEEAEDDMRQNIRIQKLQKISNEIRQLQTNLEACGELRKQLIKDRNKLETQSRETEEIRDSVAQYRQSLITLQEEQNALQEKQKELQKEKVLRANYLEYFKHELANLLPVVKEFMKREGDDLQDLPSDKLEALLEQLQEELRQNDKKYAKFNEKVAEIRTRNAQNAAYIIQGYDINRIQDIRVLPKLTLTDYIKADEVQLKPLTNEDLEVLRQEYDNSALYNLIINNDKSLDEDEQNVDIEEKEVDLAVNAHLEKEREDNGYKKDGTNVPKQQVDNSREQDEDISKRSFGPEKFSLYIDPRTLKYTKESNEKLEFMNTVNTSYALHGATIRERDAAHRIIKDQKKQFDISEDRAEKQTQWQREKALEVVHLINEVWHTLAQDPSNKDLTREWPTTTKLDRVMYVLDILTKGAQIEQTIESLL
ncbi:hypothetical protein Sarmat_00821 [Rickettsiales endosymbiont of Paramecium tredecaurelia]|uniref:hypothetical protein n=1 Tax=Candidatus Sarmatiella mevalonica TaxID=2770581 RepID=UPI0019226698|nr:hypothetical protein [Candidatus Sarmatiella mevalonica]MBL3284961.1 hypothetical protein [Candidatus Sarmatiella mevalonica]